jgi:hypothetical protein
MKIFSNYCISILKFINSTSDPSKGQRKNTHKRTETLPITESVWKGKGREIIRGNFSICLVGMMQTAKVLSQKIYFSRPRFKGDPPPPPPITKRQCYTLDRDIYYSKVLVIFIAYIMIKRAYLFCSFCDLHAPCVYTKCYKSFLFFR